MASIPEHEYEYNRMYSIYGNLTKMIEFYHGGRGFLTNEDTVRKLLWLIKERTGINYVPESAVVDARAESYSEGYETGRVETRRAYEGKRYTEAEMDKHGQYKYQEGYQEGKRVQETVKRSITSLFPTEAAVTVVYDNGYRDGVEEGKRQYDWLRKQAEAKYKDLKVKYDKLEQETKAIEKHSDTAYDKGYLKGIEECTTKNATVLGDLMQKMESKGYQKGFDEGTKDKTEYVNEMQKNLLYNVNATRVVEGTVEFYDIVIEGSDTFDVFDTQFIINFNETNTKLLLDIPYIRSLIEEVSANMGNFSEK